MSFAKTYEQARASYKPLPRSSIKRGTKQMKRSRIKRHRISLEETAWRNEVLKRANYQCQWLYENKERCQTKGDKNLEAHHRNKRSQRPDLKLDLANGAALCRFHHRFIDSIYGRIQALKQRVLVIDTYEAAQKRKREGGHES
jgi:predicted restriction endonuclease